MAGTGGGQGLSLGSIDSITRCVKMELILVKGVVSLACTSGLSPTPGCLVTHASDGVSAARHDSMLLLCAFSDPVVAAQVPKITPQHLLLCASRALARNCMQEHCSGTTDAVKVDYDAIQSPFIELRRFILCHTFCTVLASSP